MFVRVVWTLSHPRAPEDHCQDSDEPTNEDGKNIVLQFRLREHKQDDSESNVWNQPECGEKQIPDDSEVFECIRKASSDAMPTNFDGQSPLHDIFVDDQSDQQKHEQVPMFECRFHILWQNYCLYGFQINPHSGFASI